MKLDTIVVGDCLDVMADMLDESVDMVMADPPYAVNKGFVGEDFTEAELKKLLSDVAFELKRICKANANIVIDASIQRLPLFFDAILPQSLHVLDTCLVQQERSNL